MRITSEHSTPLLFQAMQGANRVRVREALQNAAQLTERAHALNTNVADDVRSDKARSADGPEGSGPLLFRLLRAGLLGDADSFAAEQSASAGSPNPPNTEAPAESDAAQPAPAQAQEPQPPAAPVVPIASPAEFDDDETPEEPDDFTHYEEDAASARPHDTEDDPDAQPSAAPVEDLPVSRPDTFTKKDLDALLEDWGEAEEGAEASIYDFDGDGRVGVMELTHLLSNYSGDPRQDALDAFSASYRSRVGDAHYKAEFDYDGSGYIGPTDMAKMLIDLTKIVG